MHMHMHMHMRMCMHMTCTCACTCGPSTTTQSNTQAPSPCPQPHPTPPLPQDCFPAPGSIGLAGIGVVCMTSGLTANYAEVENTRPDPWTSYEDAFDACEDGGHAAVVSATGNCASVVYSGACSSDDTLCYNNAAVSSISSALWATFAHEVFFTLKPHHPCTNFPSPSRSCANSSTARAQKRECEHTFEPQLCSPPLRTGRTQSRWSSHVRARPLN